MSPEDKEIEQLGAEVSAAYRATADAQPSAGVDAAILEAARREARRPRRRAWQVPAAVAAVLVLGVTLTLRMRDDFGGLPPPAPAPAQKPAAATVPARAAPDVRADAAGASAQERKAESLDRPSRDRMERPDRQAEERIAPQAQTAPRSELAARPAPSLEQQQAYAPAREQARAADGGAESELADAVPERRSLAMRKQAPAASVAERNAQEWMREIESLLRQGRTEEAHAQFAEFRRHHPDLAVSEALQPLAREFDAETAARPSDGRGQ